MTRPVALVLRALGVGDFFTGLPALGLVRAALPEHRIVLALPRSLWPLAALCPSLDDVVESHELEPIRGAPSHPNVAIDLHGNGPESVAVLEATGPSRLIAYAHGGERWCPSEHEVARWCRLVRSAFGIRAEAPDVCGALPQPPDVSVPAGLTVVHCGAKAAARQWPAARFATVAWQLRERGHEVWVVGGPNEAGRAAAIGSAAGVPSTSTLTLVELVAVIARARLLVCADSGPAHIATNFGTASVVLFGPTSPDIWGPPRISRHQVLWPVVEAEPRPGQANGDRLDPTLARIDADAVLAAAERADAARRLA